MNPQTLDRFCVTTENNEKILVSTIYCIGRNYSDHVKELANTVPKESPVVFLKSRASLRGLAHQPLGFIEEFFHFEAEFVLLIGCEVPLGGKASWDDVRAVGLGIDLTRREVQNDLKKQGLPWTTAKSFAGSAVVGPMVERRNLGSQTDFEFQFSVNTQLKQRGDTSKMIFSIPHILNYLASFNGLSSGDLIFTGTPAGVGPISKGDTFELKLLSPDRTWSGVL